MPARPISPETLQLIDTMRDALAGCADVEEKTMFGCHVFMVNGKMCLGVENDELLVRLPPQTHAQVAETAGVRPLSPRGGMQGYFLVGPSAYSTREAWQYWIDGALAFNPLAKATPKKKPKAAAESADPDPDPKKQKRTAPPARKRHSVFDSDL
ncbi:TfoX/Sxy family protein [Comamonas odontotermitis]|uniref:TfoX/Sxy family protein n=1 Tax=Comamonas odontotermitis TaxID=379895 RepID=UPI001CC3B99A|nr:TfoX/Sxy family protein [Comamonas odontotermitis]UBB18814.1 TfoX/Sxy family protein [Comamonas odontotermitis]